MQISGYTFGHRTGSRWHLLYTCSYRWPGSTGSHCQDSQPGSFHWYSPDIPNFTTIPEWVSSSLYLVLRLRQHCTAQCPGSTPEGKLKCLLMRYWLGIFQKRFTRDPHVEWGLNPDVGNLPQWGDCITKVPNKAFSLPFPRVVWYQWCCRNLWGSTSGTHRAISWWSRS